MNYQCIRNKRNQNWKIWHHVLISKLNHTSFDLAQPWKSSHKFFPFVESRQERKNEDCSLKCHLELSQLKGGVVNSWINCINIFLSYTIHFIKDLPPKYKTWLYAQKTNVFHCEKWKYNDSLHNHNGQKWRMKTHKLLKIGRCCDKMKSLLKIRVSKLSKLLVECGL